MTDEAVEVSLGKQAPDFCLKASSGGEVSLTDFRLKSNVVIFFVREYNWIQCRAFVGQLGRLYEDIKSKNCEVLVILGEPLEKAQQYAEIFHLHFPVLADPERSVYHRFGLDKALFLIQRTACLIIDQEGTVCYLKRVVNPMAWLQEDQELLKAVSDLA